jgi:hypothetical protein
MRNMIVVAGLVAGLAAGNAQAEWADVSYTATLTEDSVYCSEFESFIKLLDYTKDQNMRGAQKMVDEGVCGVTSGPMKIEVYQSGHVDQKQVIRFISPSGKKFITLGAFTQ